MLLKVYHDALVKAGIEFQNGGKPRCEVGGLGVNLQ